MRKSFGGKLIINGGYDLETGNAIVAEGQVDAVAFGVLFLANPDLPARLAAGGPLNAPDFAMLYTPGEKGYTDYPALG